jgi:hypothetical protein
MLSFHDNKQVHQVMFEVNNKLLYFLTKKLTNVHINVNADERVMTITPPFFYEKMNLKLCML